MTERELPDILRPDNNTPLPAIQTEQPIMVFSGGLVGKEQPEIAQLRIINRRIESVFVPFKDGLVQEAQKSIETNVARKSGTRMGRLMRNIMPGKRPSELQTSWQAQSDEGPFSRNFQGDLLFATRKSDDRSLFLDHLTAFNIALTGDDSEIAPTTFNPIQFNFRFNEDSMVEGVTVSWNGPLRIAQTELKTNLRVDVQDSSPWPYNVDAAHVYVRGEEFSAQADPLKRFIDGNFVHMQRNAKIIPTLDHLEQGIVGGHTLIGDASLQFNFKGSDTPSVTLQQSLDLEKYDERWDKIDDLVKRKLLVKYVYREREDGSESFERVYGGDNASEQDIMRKQCAFYGFGNASELSVDNFLELVTAARDTWPVAA